MKKILVLSIFATLLSCNKDDGEQENIIIEISDGIGINSQSQMKGYTNGDSIEFSVDLGHQLGTGRLSTSSNDKYYYSYLSGFEASDNSSFSIAIGSVLKDNATEIPTRNEYNTLFNKTNYQFIDIRENFGVVNYTDASGTEWTSFDLKQPENSTFQLEDYEERLSFGDTITKVFAKFNCTLYNQNDDSLVITDGVFVNSYFFQ